MTQWLEVDSWLDLVANAWIGIVLIAVAAVPSILAARSHKTIGVVRDQLVNGHKAPMREDLDKAITAISELGHDVRMLRQDLMAEEDHRRLQISDLRDELEHRTGKHRRI